MTGKHFLTELLAGLDGVTAVMLTAKQAKELGEYVEKIERERDELAAAKWKQQHVDTMNDMASLRIALESAESRASIPREGIGNLRCTMFIERPAEPDLFDDTRTGERTRAVE